MLKLLNLIVLDKEAKLFDSKEFLLKTFFAVLLGGLIGKFIPYLSGDMISLLFGMMLTIEPVNLTGIKSGLKQLQATVIGAVITGVLLSILGYTLWSAALSITAALYVSLLIDWRNYSVVAVFTSIYMNFLVQRDAFGNPSEIETFKLRIAALAVGIAVAFFINWIFSLMGYKHMLEKRLYHLLDTLHGKMNTMLLMMERHTYEEALELLRQLPELFNSVDWIYSTAKDLQKDPVICNHQKNQIKLEKIIKMTGLIRDMAHINYSICFKVVKGNHDFMDVDFVKDYRRTVNETELLMEKLDSIIRNREPKVAVGRVREGNRDESVDYLNVCIWHADDLLTHY